MNGVGRRNALAICALLFFLAGCAAPKWPELGSGDKLYSVSTKRTPFYRYGPQQGNGADMQLQRDTLMTLIRPSFGYSKVHLMTGEEGYVASEDIHVAPAALIASINPPQPRPHANGDRFNLESNDPRLIAPPEDLPEPTALPGTTP